MFWFLPLRPFTSHEPASTFGLRFPSDVNFLLRIQRCATTPVWPVSTSVILMFGTPLIDLVRKVVRRNLVTHHKFLNHRMRDKFIRDFGERYGRSSVFSFRMLVQRSGDCTEDGLNRGPGNADGVIREGGG